MKTLTTPTTKTTAPRKPRAFTGWLNPNTHPTQSAWMVWKTRSPQSSLRVRVVPLPAKSAKGGRK